jgi:hypothetical protein
MHEAKPTLVPIGTLNFFAFGGYAQRTRSPYEYFADTVTQTVDTSVFSHTTEHLGSVFSRARTYQEVIPETFPNPDQIINKRITETITVEPFSITLSVAPTTDNPIYRSHYYYINSWDFKFPVEAELLMSPLRGVYRIEGPTESFETAFEIPYELVRVTESTYGTVHVGEPLLYDARARLFGIGATLEPITPLIAEGTVDGIPFRATARPYRIWVPEPVTASWLTAAIGIAAWRRRSYFGGNRQFGVR